MKVCKKCGAKYDGDVKFCKVCGGQLKEVKKKKWPLIIGLILVAVLLAGGGFGVYKYVEEKKQDAQQEEERREKEQEEKDKKEQEEKSEEKEEKAEQEESEKEEKTEEEKAKEKEQAELLKKYEEQEKAEAEAAAQMKQVLAYDEVEDEVLRIRGIFNECMAKCGNGSYRSKEIEGGYNAWSDNGQLKMINTTVTTTTDSYERIFVYEDGTLIFAYLKEDGNESRLYYKDDNIFRWSYPKNTDIHDNDFENPEFIQNGMDGRTLGYELYTKATGQTKSFGTGSLSDEIVYQKLVEHYKKGTEDSPGDEMTVMEGSSSENVYSTSVRCGVPGNASASQVLYWVSVDMTTGEVTQERTLTDGKITTYNLND